MAAETILFFLVILLIVLVYVYIKQPWKKGYVYVTKNGKLAKHSGYKSAHKEYTFKSTGREVNIGQKSSSKSEDYVQKTQNAEKTKSSKFDFLFGKKEE